MECCNCDSFSEDEDEDYSLITQSPKDIAQLKVIGELYINRVRYHAYGDHIYNDNEVQVAIMIHDEIAWY